MAKTYTNKTGKKVGTDNSIDLQIKEMKECASELIREQDYISHDNVDALKKLYNYYRSLSDKLSKNKELSTQQQSEASAVRVYFNKNVKKGLIKLIDQTIQSREEAQSILKADEEKQARTSELAKENLGKLMPDLEEAANRYLKANLNQSRELLEQYKLIQARVLKNLDKGNKSSVTKLQELRAQVDAVSQRVNRHSQKLHQEETNTRKVISNALQTARKNIKEASVLGLIKKLAPGLTTRETLSILNQPSINLSVESAGAIIFSNMPGSSQTMLLNALFNAVGESTQSTGPLASFAKVVGHQIKGLLSGEMQYLSIVALNKQNEMQMIHLPIAQLLANPHETLTSAMYALYEQGVSDEQIMLQLTSHDQVEALLKVGGLNLELLQKTGTLEPFVRLLAKQGQYTPEQMTGLIGFDAKNNSIVPAGSSVQQLVTLLTASNMTISDALKQLGIEGNTLRIIPNAQSLEAIVGLITSPDGTALVNSLRGVELSPESSSALQSFQENRQPPTPLTPMEIAELASTVETMLEARSLLLGHTEPKEEEIQDLPEETEALLSSLNGDQLDLSEEEKKFEQLVTKLMDIRTHLSEKTFSNGAVKTLDDAIKKLQDAGGKFFDEDINMTSFNNFKKEVEDQFKGVKSVLEQHRGWHSINEVFKGILGVLAAIAVIPALVVQATAKEGYLRTFFAKPETQSAKMLKEAKKTSEDLNSTLEGKIPNPKGDDESGYKP